MNRKLKSFGGAAVFAMVVGCGGDDDSGAAPKACSVAEQTGCEQGLVCEPVAGRDPIASGCFAPIAVKGRVFDNLSSLPIASARVVARDANDAVVSSVALTAVDGTYQLNVPVRRLDAEGTPEETQYTLRADAAGFLSFPRAPRVALPVEVSQATGTPKVVQNAATDIGLIPLPNAAELGSVSGRVLSDAPGGTLIVAGGATGIADRDGAYTVFNVPAGQTAVAGYAASVNLASVTADIRSGATTEGVDLGVLSAAAATVSGSVQIVNASGGASTSVILVVEDTFVETIARGEAPIGLRATNVTGSWSIPNVPDGKYVVLAAFENDDLVRDPDTSIGGTAIQHITVTAPGASVPGFKVTGALAVISPGADATDRVSGTPRFIWEDDSSEDGYHVELYDAFGTLIWQTEGAFDMGGSRPAEVAYSGPALTAGMIYQFRATSRKANVAISRTEDLKGVFAYE
jgi:hypothetical protein